MANVDKPFGLRPVRHLDGSPYNGACIICHVPATDSTLLGLGDAVKLAGSGAATLGSQGRPTVTRVAAGDAIWGVVVGVHPETWDANIYREASTARDVLVCVDKTVIYHIQEDSVGATGALTDIGNTADLTVANANTTTGLSAMELDTSDIGTGAGLQILGLAKIEGNEIGANAIWEVKINEHQSADAAAGV